MTLEVDLEHEVVAGHEPVALDTGAVAHPDVGDLDAPVALLVLGQTLDAVLVAEGAQHVGRGAVDGQLTLVEHDRPVAERADDLEAVGDEDDGAAVPLEGPDLVEALLLEGLVTDREHLVDEQDLGVDVDGDGEGQPDVHAAE